MNVTELGTLIDAATDVLRVETLESYASSSDHDWVAAYLRGDPPPDPTPKQWYLDGLRRRAHAGHPQRRLRMVPRPVSNYLRYAAEWGYVDNVAAGEDVRILDENDPGTPTVWVGDYYVLDKQVVAMRYDENGAFVEAWAVREPARLAELAEQRFAAAVPFAQWWAANPHLHRDPVPC